MLKRKVYRVITGVELSFSALVNKQRVLITFNGEGASFSTINTEIQKRIEGRTDYGKLIKLVSEKEVENHKEKFIQTITEEISEEKRSRPDDIKEKEIVVNETDDWQAAKEFLRGEPFNIMYQAIGTPEKILAKAAEVGVQFPNLRLD